MTSKRYAGIGSRETPTHICQLMKRLAARLEKEGWVLRSGGASGADASFERGVFYPANKEIYLPGATFNGRSAKNSGYIDATKLESFPKALKTVKLFHPAPGKLSQKGRLLMARNAMQVLGADLNDPSDIVIAWTPEGKLKGGTSQALRIADFHNIPIFNLGLTEIETHLSSWLDSEANFQFL